MEKIILLLLMVMWSVSGFGQDLSNLVLGNWSFFNETTLTDSIVDSSIEQFDLKILNNNNFVATSTNQIIKGQWNIVDSTLNLRGKELDSTQMKAYDLPIFQITNDKMSLKFRGEAGQTLVNLIKNE